MLTPSQIREIARRQRQRSVEVVCVKTDDHSIRIRIAGAPLERMRASTATAPPAVDPARLVVRSENLGTAVLSNREALARAWKNGDTVDRGQVLAFVELGDDRHPVFAPAQATVETVLVNDGQCVDYGMPLFELTSVVGAAA